MTISAENALEDRRRYIAVTPFDYIEPDARLAKIIEDAAAEKGIVLDEGGESAAQSLLTLIKTLYVIDRRLKNNSKAA
ncbi:MAG: hypothetical protein ABW189_08095 [Rickettsiales bacterium]